MKTMSLTTMMSLKTTMSLTACVIAAAVLIGPQTAAAADLDYRTVPAPDRYSQAYEDPRYRDLYAPEPRAEPRGYSYAPQPYAPQYVPAPHPVPQAYVYRDGYRERDRDRFDERRYSDACLPRGEIKRRLSDGGWHDFHDLDSTGNVTRVKARRHNGDLFALKVDRCNGEVVRADLIERGGIGPYADGSSQRRYERPYY